MPVQSHWQEPKTEDREQIEEREDEPEQDKDKIQESITGSALVHLGNESSCHLPKRVRAAGVLSHNENG